MDVDAATGRAFVANAASNGSVVVLDSSSGQLLRTVVLPTNPGSVASFQLYAYTQSHRVVIYAQDGTQFTLNPATGAVTRVGKATQADPPLPVVGYPPHAITFAADGMRVLDVARHTLVRTLRLPFGVSRTDARDPRLFFLAGDGKLLIVDDYHGIVLHTTTLRIGASPRLVVCEQAARLLVLSTNGILYVVDSRTGALLGRQHVALPTLTYSTNLLLDEQANRLVLANPGDNSVMLFDSLSGRFLGAPGVGTHLTAAALDRRGHVLMVSTDHIDTRGYPTGDGDLRIVDLRGGQLLRTIRVGIAPIAVAVDDRTSRAFVLNANSNPDFTPLNPRLQRAAPTNWLSRFHQWLPFLPEPQTDIVQSSVAVFDTASW